MNWKQGDCGDRKCRFEHHLYYDENTGEVVGQVSGPYEFSAWRVAYKGEMVAEFLASDQAMQRLVEIHNRAAAPEADHFAEKFRAMAGKLAPVLKELAPVWSAALTVLPLGLESRPVRAWPEPGLYWAFYENTIHLARWDGEDWNIYTSASVTAPRSAAVAVQRLEPSEPPPMIAPPPEAQPS